MPRPDAVMIAVSLCQGTKNLRGKIHAISDIADPILQCDTLNGERSHIRSEPINGFVFVTRDPTDTFNYPLTSPQARKPRYTWAVQPGSDGKVRIGTLIEQPTPTPTPAPIPSPKPAQTT